MEDYWKSKKNFWTVSNLEKLRDEYLSLSSSYHHFQEKPKIIEKRLEQIRSQVPKGTLKKWEEELEGMPKRGDKLTPYFTEPPLSEVYKPFNSIKRYAPAYPYYRHGPETRERPETVALKVLKFIESVGSQGIKYSHILNYLRMDEMSLNKILRRLENTGLVMRERVGHYRITIKGKEAIKEIMSEGKYYPFED